MPTKYVAGLMMCAVVTACAAGGQPMAPPAAPAVQTSPAAPAAVSEGTAESEPPAPVPHPECDRVAELVAHPERVDLRFPNKAATELGCALSRKERNANRDAWHAAVDETERQREWVSSHCARTPNMLTDEQRRLMVDPSGRLVYEKPTIYIANPAFYCPKGTAKDLADFAARGAPPSPMRERLVEDHDCQDADLEVKDCPAPATDAGNK